MGLFRLIFGGSRPKSHSSVTQPPPLTQRVAPKSSSIYSTGGKRIVKADEVFMAWSSGDMKRMLAATSYSTNLVDRHFLLLNIVMQAYKDRKEPEMRRLFREYAALHLREFPEIKPQLIKDIGVLPRVSTYQYLATVLTEDGAFEEAVAVCKAAIELGLEDGTKSGFEGRIARIRKKTQQ